MKLHNLQKVSNFKVEEWLEKNIRNLTDYQKQWIRNEEIIRFAPFYFYKRRKRITNVFLRLTIIFIIPIGLILYLGLPFNFIITGNCGYKNEKIEWFQKWVNNCGL